MNSKKLMAVSLIIALSVSAAACGTMEETGEAEKVAVEVQNPETGNLSVDTTYIGTIAPQEQVYVLPMVSGTVTETFYEVGDVVAEGDVLFKIDDEAYQLQLKSAQASYSSAQAGVTAQSGGARHLQNYQTEQQIQQLRDSLNDTYADLDDLEEQKDDLEDAADELSSGLKAAQAGVTAAMTAYNAAKVDLGPKITSKQIEIANIEKEIAAKEIEIEKEKEEEPETDTSALEAELAALKLSLVDPKMKLSELEMQLAGYETAVNTAQSTITSIQTQMANISSGKAQIESGIDQLEAGQDTIRDNLAMAEQAYSITQNEIYPETDTASAAQLRQVAVGIDSAKMQIDYCTVKAPISGIIESVNVQKNGMAAAGNPAYIISNKESMTVTFHVAEKAKNTLAVGDHVSVEHNGMVYDGNITEIGTMAGQQTRLFQVKASVMGASNSLPNGVSVKVNAETQKENGKLIIPYDALYFSGGNAYVYCVENNTIIRTPVTVGLMSDTEAVIEDGLTTESLVVSNWSSKLRDRAEVEVVSINGEKVINSAGSAEDETAEEAE